MKKLATSIPLLALFIVSLVGCNGTSDQETDQNRSEPTASTPSQSLPPVEAPARTSSEHRSAEETMNVPALIEETGPSRNRKRLNIDQLGKAILAASDGLKWAQSNDDDLLETLAFTLGKPDYLEVTKEDLGATVLFMKFLEDAAGSVCRQMVDRDLDNESAVFLNQDEVPLDIHMQALLLRFHSRALPQGHPDLKQWVWLYETALHLADSSADAWSTVCVALFRHPDFYSY